MKENFLLQSKNGKKLYKKYGKLPIIDYHCHLSPKEIYEDKPFENIGEMWLSGDHYKWRLMRNAGIDESLITGKASWHDKFIAYAKAVEIAGGSPLYHWTHMELSEYFGIDEFLCTENAEKIWDCANEFIKNTEMSPKKLIKYSGVEVICTTDEITSQLEYHKMLSEDKNFGVKVLPTFRTDSLMQMKKENFREFLQKLSEVSKIEVKDFGSLKSAVTERLEFFVKMGCRLSDVGIPFFPDAFYGEEKAAEVFDDILNKKDVSHEDLKGLAGNLYLFLGELYKEFDITMQLHVAVFRNINTEVYSFFGNDGGVDSVGDTISGKHIAALFDRLNSENALPKTILYSLNPSNMEQLGSISSAFRNVTLGPSWWFWDHKRGIETQIDIVSESGCLGKFTGMQTDSRSFLSYARHDYFRRIFCEKVGIWVDRGELSPKSADIIVKKVFYENPKEIIG